MTIESFLLIIFILLISTISILSQKTKSFNTDIFAAFPTPCKICDAYGNCVSSGSSSCDPQSDECSNNSDCIGSPNPTPYCVIDGSCVADGPCCQNYYCTIPPDIGEPWCMPKSYTPSCKQDYEYGCQYYNQTCCSSTSTCINNQCLPESQCSKNNSCIAAYHCCQDYYCTIPPDIGEPWCMPKSYETPCRDLGMGGCGAYGVICCGDYVCDNGICVADLPNGYPAGWPCHPDGFDCMQGLICDNSGGIYTCQPPPNYINNQADANYDSKVDESDYQIYKDNYGVSGNQGKSIGDFDNNARVDGIDYIIWLIKQK